MASRPILTPHSVITNQSMATQVISEVTIVQTLSGVYYDISWEDGAACEGTFSVQISNTYKQNGAGKVEVEGNWQDLPIGDTAIVASDSGNGGINCIGIACYAIRLVYTPTAGDGVLNAKITGKVA